MTTFVFEVDLAMQQAVFEKMGEKSLIFQSMKYRHLFFDLDHTLWDFEANAKECFQELYIDKHLQSRGIDDFEAFFSAYSAHNERLWSEYTKGLILQAELRWRRMWLALVDFGVEDEPLSKAMSVGISGAFTLQKEPVSICHRNIGIPQKQRLYLAPNHQRLSGNSGS